MVAEVYYAHRRATMGEGLLEKVTQLFNVAGFARFIEPQAQVAIKVTFPERGNITHVRPQFMRRIVDQIRKAEGSPYITDSLRLNGSNRAQGIYVLDSLHEQGFTYGAVRAPILLANGINGLDVVPVENKGGQPGTSSVPSALQGADAIIAVSHFTGHKRLGFAGSLCNMGMATLFDKDTRAADLNLAQEVVEGCAAVVHGKTDRCGYFNFLLEMTADTDYCSGSDAPMMADVGILASRDPVALDQASVDLFNQQIGVVETRLPHSESSDKLRTLFPQAQWRTILECAEAMGLGSRDYELMVV